MATAFAGLGGGGHGIAPDALGVLAEALAGASHGQGIDALIDAAIPAPVAGQLLAQAAMSHLEFGGLAGIDAGHVLLDQMAIHPDAVHPV